jgi:hypothetical protein
MLFWDWRGYSCVIYHRFTCTYVCMCACMYVCNIHTRTHTHTHTHSTCILRGGRSRNPQCTTDLRAREGIFVFCILFFTRTHTLPHQRTHKLAHARKHTLAHARTHTLAHTRTHTLAHPRTHPRQVRDECLQGKSRDFEGYNAVPPPLIVPLDLSQPRDMAAAVSQVCVHVYT